MIRLALIVLSSVVLTPLQAFAQGFVTCGKTSSDLCTSCDIIEMSNLIIQWLIGITFLFFAIIAVYHGFKLVTSGGNSGAKSAAKSGFTNAFIGLFIILGAWLLIDTIVRGVVRGSNGEIEGYGPWAEIKCAEHTSSGIQTISIAEAEFVPMPPRPIAVAAGSGPSGTGSCSIPTSNTCSVESLNQLGNNCFGSNVNVMSQICMRESGGNPRASSGTDKCADGNSWSFGLFQVNLIAHGSALGCGNNIISINTAGAQTENDRKLGTCMPGQYRTIPGTSVRYCAVRNCRVANRAGYNSCIAIANNPRLNVQYACSIYRSSGLRHWGGSAKRCGL
jgi:Type IV secretion system pilin